MEQLLERVTAAVAEELGLPIEASGRHVHLSRRDVEALFGAGHRLTPVRPLSQPGQFVCAERVTVVGPKGALERVVVLGPERRETQIEVSLTDGITLGISPPVRLSGDLAGTPGAELRTEQEAVTLSRGLIAARRHIHLTPADAARRGLTDGQIVRFKCLTGRPVRLDDMVVRVSEQSAAAVHIDYDEANACGWRPGDRGVVV